MNSYLARAVLCVVSLLYPLPARAQSWQSHLKDELSLMGHRNWILIVDSAYPEQVGLASKQLRPTQISSMSCARF